MKTITKTELFESLGAFKSVHNMTSSSGNRVANQFIIHFEHGSMFQSYNSIIAVKFPHNESVCVGKDWDYSTTTGKYRNAFLDEDKKTTYKKIVSGEYEVIIEG